MSLHFVNKNPNRSVSICLVWYNTGCSPPWRKTGWWNLSPGAGVTPLIGNLNNRYYYFYAEASDGAYWGEPNRRVAVVNRAFDACMDTIFEPNRIVPLRQIDTGSYTDYTLNLL